MKRRNFARIASASLLGSASLVSLASAAHAQEVLFSSTAQIPNGPIATGRDMSIAGGTVQVRLPGGAIASFVDAAQFSIRPDGAIDLRTGSVTVVASGGETTVHMPEGVRGLVSSGGTGNFTANASGLRGSATAGSISVTGNGATKFFTVGQFWTAGGGRAPDRVIAGVAAAVPGIGGNDDGGPVQPLREGGIVAAAENGIPIALGEALAAAGARGDIVAAARRIEAYDGNPNIATFPTGDYSLLVAYAAQATSPLGGGIAFNGASADIIRTYFQYLAAGNAGANFRTAYAAILVNYLDLVRSGVLPSTFRGATQAQLNAYLAFIGRTDGFGSLSVANKQLLDAYLAFLTTGGSADNFGVGVTNLTTAFLNFVRAGGQPAAFTQASASVVAQYLAIVQSGGLKTNLTAQNQALLTAYLNANGIGFVQTNATALAAFVAYLNAGGLPSGYTALPAATLRAYLETLETTGLFDTALGSQAVFLRTYLTFLRGGGTADQFNALPINVARVNASALTLYVDYLLGGGVPSAYTALTQAQIRAYLDQLTAVGQFNGLLGANAAFLAEYYAYLKTGADADSFAGLPAVDVNAYASALSIFAAYLRAGNLPSGYSTLTAQQIRSYLTALQVSGKLALLGDNATLLGDYLVYIRTGGSPDLFAGLPIATYQSYAVALSNYFAFLNGGGLPSGYSALTQAQIRLYLDALKANGQLALLGTNATFYTNYLAFLSEGGSADAFTGLPIVTFQGYATALNAYFAFLNRGGLPSSYTALTQAQIRAYLDALKTANQLSALLDANATFYTNYLTFLAGGGAPDAFTGLPIVTFQGYATALNAYYAFLVGGGSPSAYPALTQAQIRTYLDALSAANQVAALLGTNAAFFDNYLAYLVTGGNPNAYPGLPSSIYGQYATAVNAYFTYLSRGGLPSGYTTLTQSQIREYLNVLQANNQLGALLGANATFFSNYLTYLAGGGAVDGFTGLPIVTFQGYATQLTAYYTFLAGGGLPANYTALSAAQIRQYLDALQAAGQVNALLGSNASFFTSYLTYLAGGGAPDRFQGLPAFVTYEAALRTYYAFLQGGGRPSAYTALTQAQILAYFRALDGAGLIALKLTATEAAFLRDYAAFVASGANADQFAGLPVNQGPTVPVVTQGLANAPRGNTSTLATAAAGVGLFSAATTTGSVAIEGNSVTSVAGTRSIANQNATTVESRTVDATVGIARLSSGTVNTGNNIQLSAQTGMHMVWGIPATNMPSTGTATFGMVTATSPTRDSGGVAPGTFTGNLAVALATQRVGWDSVIAMDGVNYRFATAGGIVTPSIAISSTNTFSGTASTANNGLAGNGSGFFAGVGGNLVGFAYLAQGPGVNGEIEGTAVFGRNAPVVTLPTVTPPNTQPSLGYSYAAGLPTTGLRLLGNLPQANNQVVNQIIDSVTASPAADGTLASIGGSGNATYLPIARTSAKSADVAGNARAVVGRWYDGRVTPTGLSFVDLTANQGYHYTLLAPTTFTVPYLGRVDYTLAAATRPTFGWGVAAPGVFDARMSVLFRSTPLIGFQGTIVMPEASGAATYSFTTPGGVAAPSYASEADTTRGYFQLRAGMTGAGLACTTNCSLVFTGSFAGADPLAAGGTYRTYGNQSGTGEYLTGAASFAGSWVGGAQTVSTVTNRQLTSILGASTGLNVNQGSYDVDATGRVVGLTNFNGLYDRLGTAQIAQSGAATSGNLGWTRWSDGSLDLRRNGGVNSVVLNANQGYQILHGAAATALPTTGTVSYTLTGGTAPTDHAGTLAPGTLGTGAAAVSFGATSKVAFDFTTAIGGATYNLFTAGKIAGIANSEITLTSGAFNNVIGPGGNVTGGTCADTQCRPIWNGFLAGAGGTELGLNYQVQNTATQFRFGGVAAFTRDTVQGGGGSVTMPTQPTYVYRGGFDTSSRVLARRETDAASRLFIADGGTENISASVAADGSVAQFNGGALGTNGRGTATNLDMAGDSAILIGRWAGGDQVTPLGTFAFGANDATHYLLARPDNNRSLPTGTTVQYTLIGATRPTMYGANVAPGVFDARMAISFGSTASSRIGIEGSLYMPETGGTAKYDFATPGGVAAPGGTFSTALNATNFAFNTALSGNGAACSVGSTCTIAFDGRFGGPNTTRFGVIYNTTTSVQTGTGIMGAAAFGAAGTIPAIPAAGSGTGTATGQTTFAFYGGQQADFGSTTTSYEGNALKSYINSSNQTRVAGVTQEGGRLAETIGWARWTGDTAGPLTNQLPNSGVHILTGTPTTTATLPGSGTVQYSLVGGTKPTVVGAATAAPGTLTGSLSIAFGTLPRVGMDLTATVGNFGYRVQTTGGVANPTQSEMVVTASGRFNGNFDKGANLSGTTASSCAGVCTAGINGQLYGAGGQYAGLGLMITDQTSQGNVTTTGVGIFAKQVP